MFDVLHPKASGLLRSADVSAVAASLRDGGLAVLPTETGYMIAALATSEQAVQKVFTAKRRSLTNTMHVACASVEMAQTVAIVDEHARRLLGELTPGPLTVVVGVLPILPTNLVTAGGTVGIRIPEHAATLQVIASVGVPLTATSLNVSGAPAIATEPAELARLDWPAGGVVHVVEDDKAVAYALPSTIVRVNGTGVAVLREGPISRAAVLSVLEWSSRS